MFRHAIGLALVREAGPGVRTKQEELYEDRLMELRQDREVLSAAVRIAKSFSGDGGDSRTYGEIDGLVVASLTNSGKPPDRAVDIINRLHDVGFVWRITKAIADNWEAGIPSLMQYTLAKHGDRN